MKIDIFDTKAFVELNHLQEVTSHVLFQRGDVPHPNGLVSNEIFGVTTKSRKETYAYINLYNNYFNPHVYKAIRRMYRNIDRIINGELYVSIDKDGYLVEDHVNGDTGLEFIYNNWENIKWEEKESSGISMRDERITLLKKCKKSEIFMQYQIVIPAFYRDIKTGSSTRGGETDDINNLYSKLIRLASLVKNQDMFDFQFNSTNYNIQLTLIAIYDYFKNKLEKKNGLIRKYLMGKNVDYCTRTVITTPTYHADRPEDLQIDMKHSLIPLSQLCTLIYPYMVYYLKNFFEREIFDNRNAKIVYDPKSDELKNVEELDHPEELFNDKYIKKMLDMYQKDPESRFTKIEVPTVSGEKFYLAFSGKRMDSSTTVELAPLVQRPMTWTDLLYLAASDAVKDKHALITRYPLNDEFGTFPTEIRIGCTLKTVPMMINGILYRWYPDIDPDIPRDKIGSICIDSTAFSNSYLPGIEGD